MDQNLLSELKTQATFVAGKGSYLRNEEAPEVIKAVSNAETLIDKLPDILENPEISGGTTANPETILSLFWPVYSKRGIFGITVNFNANSTCRVSWSSPDIDEYTLNDVSFQELIRLDLARIYANVKLSAQAFHRKLTF